VYLLVFHAYINEMHGSPVKNLVRQRCAEGFNSGVKGLNTLDILGFTAGVSTDYTRKQLLQCGQFRNPKMWSLPKYNFSQVESSVDDKMKAVFRC
jgi:hypothetical protein